MTYIEMPADTIAQISTAMMMMKPFVRLLATTMIFTGLFRTILGYKHGIPFAFGGVITLTAFNIATTMINSGTGETTPVANTTQANESIGHLLTGSLIPLILTALIAGGVFLRKMMLNRREDQLRAKEQHREGLKHEVESAHWLEQQSTLIQDGLYAARNNGNEALVDELLARSSRLGGLVTHLPFGTPLHLTKEEAKKLSITSD